MNAPVLTVYLTNRSAPVLNKLIIYYPIEISNVLQKNRATLKLLLWQK